MSAEPAPRPRSEIRPLAILAPTYRIAEYEAHRHGLGPREWFYVTSERRVLGVEPGEYALILPVGHRLSADQCRALDYMRARRWTLRADPPPDPAG